MAEGTACRLPLGVLSQPIRSGKQRSKQTLENREKGGGLKNCEEDRGRGSVEAQEEYSSRRAYGSASLSGTSSSYCPSVGALWFRL